MEAERALAIVGLGNIGGALALQALEKGIRVAGFDVQAAQEDLVRAGLVQVGGLRELRTTLRPPRAVFLYVPAGAAVDQVLEDLAAALEPGDVLVDGGNSYWGDSVRRFRRLRAKGLHFVDLGTSGGIDGARHGACFMAGGEKETLARIEPMLRELAQPGGYVHAGPPGAGHFAKLVHNGIEFGMLQAIGEGIDLLAHHPAKLEIAGILRCWRHGSVIRSWLVDLMEAAYRAEGGLGNVPSHVEDTGEVNWLVADALRMEVPIPVIAQSAMALLSSRDADKLWARAVAMMRQGFGGHPLGGDPAVARYRRESRVGDFLHGAGAPDEPTP